jgi:hypothetical protein
MTPDEREHMDILCKQITQERDSNKFTQLVQKLNELLEETAEPRVNGPPKQTQPN